MTPHDRFIPQNDYIDGVIKVDSHRPSILRPALLLALFLAVEAALFTILLYFQVGTDADGNQVWPLAALLLPGLATCGCYLLAGKWLKEGKADRHKKRLAFGLIGCLYFLSCAMSFAFAMQLFGGLSSLFGGGFGGSLSGAAIVELVGVLIVGAIAMCAGLLVIRYEAALSEAMAWHAERKRILREHTHYRAARATQDEIAGMSATAEDLRSNLDSISRFAGQMALNRRAELAAQKERQLLDMMNDRGLTKRQRKHADAEYQRQEPRL